jgi:hypothetical protein
VAMAMTMVTAAATTIMRRRRSARPSPSESR